MINRILNADIGVRENYTDVLTSSSTKCDDVHSLSHNTGIGQTDGISKAISRSACIA